MNRISLDAASKSLVADDAPADRAPEDAWPVLAPEALHGPAGRIVTEIDPYTEADRVAVLGHVLTAIGNAIGPGPHGMASGVKHPPRFNVALVGATSRGRKGTAWAEPSRIMQLIDPTWAATRIMSGLSSGEGLIYEVRDERWESEPIREKGRVVDYQRVRVDAGATDKRLLLFEPEMGTVLSRMRSEGNSLSGLLREAWDRGTLRTITKSKPLAATGTHVSVVAHITEADLRDGLTTTDRANGFANRFMWLLVRRSKLLPDGPTVPEATIDRLATGIRGAIEAADKAGSFLIERSLDAESLWHEVYPVLTADVPGLAGAVIARAEAQVLRLSVLYAVLDQAPRVGIEHLRAGLAVWQYAEDSARRIFSRQIGRPVSDRLAATLRERGRMTRTEIRDYFGRNRSADEIEAVLTEIERAGLAVRWEEGNTPGHRVEVWGPPGQPVTTYDRTTKTTEGGV